MCWRAKPCVMSVFLLGFLAMGCASRSLDITAGTEGSGTTESNPTTDDPTFADTDPTDDTTTEDPTEDPTDDPTSADITDEDTGDGDGDGDGCMGPAPNGATCTNDCECMSSHCYVVPFLGGQCGECNEDADCMAGGCTPPDPFRNDGSLCNMGEPGAGCQTDEVCMDGLLCGNVLSLLGLIEINTCGECQSDLDCGPQICAPIVDLPMWTGMNTCIDSGSLPQDSYCNLDGNGNDACTSGICSSVDIMGLAQIGACGECNFDGDCVNGSCVPGEFFLEDGSLTGSTCM